MVGVKKRPIKDEEQQFMLTYEIDEGMTSMVTLQISADDILLIYNRFVQSIAESVHVAKVRENYRKFFKADGRIREMRSKLRHGAKQLRLRNPMPSFPLLAEPWERHGKFSRRPWHSKNNFHDPLTRAKPGFFKWWGGVTLYQTGNTHQIFMSISMLCFT